MCWSLMWRKGCLPRIGVRSKWRFKNWLRFASKRIRQHYDMYVGRISDIVDKSVLLEYSWLWFYLRLLF